MNPDPPDAPSHSLSAFLNLGARICFCQIAVRSCACKKDIISQYLAKLGRKGGKARAARHDKATLSKWAKLGGRPRKEQKKK